jgi:cyclohexyl-isocyanide hydratase
MSLFSIGFVIFPDLTQLDFTGPLQVLSRLLNQRPTLSRNPQRPSQAIAGLASCRHTLLRIVRPSI